MDMALDRRRGSIQSGAEGVAANRAGLAAEKRARNMTPPHPAADREGGGRREGHRRDGTERHRDRLGGFVLSRLCCSFVAKRFVRRMQNEVRRLEWRRCRAEFCALCWLSFVSIA